MRRFRGRGGQEGSESEKKHTYKMREELISFGDDYWIEDEDGKRAYLIDGKALRIRETLLFKDVQGNDLYKIQEKMIRLRDTMTIKDAEDGVAAVVKKNFINILRDRWKVELPDGTEMEVKGNILDHEYDISTGGKTIAEVSKKWFRVRDTYGVEIEPGQDNALILAVTVTLDQMAHD
ncbi:MAG: LURP-one-related/scramblase family protein [Methanosarcina sp.]